MMMEHPRFVGLEQVSDGWLKKYVLSFQMPDGSTKTYESISRKNRQDYLRELRCDVHTAPHADAVSIIATTDNNEILLIKEFRYPLNSWCVAFPAGLLEGDEPVETCVERELREETGYRVKMRDGRPLMKVLPQASYSSNGMTEECLRIVRAQVERAGEQETEPAEFIEVFMLPIRDIPQFLETNELPIGSRCQLVLESYGNRIGPGSEKIL